MCECPLDSVWIIDWLRQEPKDTQWTSACAAFYWFLLSKKSLKDSLKESLRESLRDRERVPIRELQRGRTLKEHSFGGRELGEQCPAVSCFFFSIWETTLNLRQVVTISKICLSLFLFFLLNRFWTLLNYFWT